MTDSRLPRWLRQSVYYHFNELKEGTWTLRYEDDLGTSITPTQVCEVRIDGPRLHNTGITICTFDITCVLSTVQATNMFTHSNMVGEVLASFTDSIVIRQMGTDADEGTSVVLECASMRGDIQVRNYDRDALKLQQSTISASYRLEI
jgi:hypothetical protein